MIDFISRFSRRYRHDFSSISAFFRPVSFVFHTIDIISRIYISRIYRIFFVGFSVRSAIAIIFCVSGVISVLSVIFLCLFYCFIGFVYIICFIVGSLYPSPFRFPRPRTYKTHNSRLKRDEYFADLLLDADAPKQIYHTAMVSVHEKSGKIRPPFKKTYIMSDIVLCIYINLE